MFDLEIGYVMKLGNFIFRSEAPTLKLFTFKM